MDILGLIDRLCRLAQLYFIAQECHNESLELAKASAKEGKRDDVGRYLDQCQQEAEDRNKTLRQLVEDCKLLVPMLHPKYDAKPILKLVAIAENMGMDTDERIDAVAIAWPEIKASLDVIVLNENQADGDGCGGNSLQVGEKKRPRWLLPDANKEVQKYLVDRENYYNSLKTKCEAGDGAAIKQARCQFGRNAISKATGIPQGTVSKTSVWQTKICPELFSKEKKRVELTQNKTYLGIAEEQAGQSKGDVTWDTAVRNETIELIRNSALPTPDAEQLVGQLNSGDISDDDARDMLDIYAEGQSSLALDRKAKRQKQSKRKSDH